MSGPPPATVALVLGRLAAAPPLLGVARLLCVDGPAGSGKTSTAAALAAGAAARGTDVRVLHMDDHYDGWEGLDGAPARVRALLDDLAAGRAGTYRPYDWYAARFGAPVEVAALGPSSLVVLEGVGAGARDAASLRSLLVWVEAAPGLRLRRAIERDGEHLADELRAWSGREAAHFDAHGTRDAADVRLDGVGRVVG